MNQAVVKPQQCRRTPGGRDFVDPSRSKKLAEETEQDTVARRPVRSARSGGPGENEKMLFFTRLLSCLASLDLVDLVHFVTYRPDMKTINIHEAKTHLSQIIERVSRGESVIISKSGKPMAVLSPYTAAAPGRKAGTMKGKIRIAGDLDADNRLIADLFDGEVEST